MITLERLNVPLFIASEKLSPRTKVKYGFTRELSDLHEGVINP